VAVGQKGAHRGGQVMAVNMVAGESSTTAQTKGHLWRSLGRRGTRCLGKAPLGDVAGGSSCNRVLEAKGDAMVLLVGLHCVLGVVTGGDQPFGRQEWDQGPVLTVTRVGLQPMVWPGNIIVFPSFEFSPNL
jgi:hypothetical protein